MEEFIFKQVPYENVRDLKNSLAMSWEDGKDVIFGMDRGQDIERFDIKLYQAFIDANERIEAGENSDKVFYDFIYDGYEQPEQLYWRNLSYYWNPEYEGDAPSAGLGCFILKILWSIHPGYDLWRDFEKDEEFSEWEEAIKIFFELLQNGCLAPYIKGSSKGFSEKCRDMVEKAEKLFEQGKDIKSRDIVRHEMIDSLYQAGYELFGRPILVTGFGTFSSLEELQSAMKSRIVQSVDIYVDALRNLMQETFIDQRFYNWLVYTNQLERFYDAYEIDMEPGEADN